MTATKHAIPSDFRPGNSYKRDDGSIMVEIQPGQYAIASVAAALGILPTKGTDHGKAKT